ncbi:hypothetical protein IMG5_185230 [Ichthyophthirius multifiliis]|uniref:Uncharacterized protein n=1 Tax=Ichthyophthirius multifiliis TaxID=5932 RepID=G0R3G0_ICHMU|nr:hypothetical protein IMG5_185230 [Ichthyophthirius multifiliis]EGR27998.1 hypothetical protein IMG5_185230 [Ichthyophthirius multifiliis]|eukprot:XP_004027343.1 hypothetical protein IMG5_185230 [Ichthyophthirius multifiliis]
MSVKNDIGEDIKQKALNQRNKVIHDNDYLMGVTSKIGGTYGIVSQANHTDKSKVANIKQGFGTIKM